LKLLKKISIISIINRDERVLKIQKALCDPSINFIEVNKILMGTLNKYIQKAPIYIILGGVIGYIFANVGSATGGI